MSIVVEGASPTALRELASRMLDSARALLRSVEVSAGLMDHIRWVGAVARVFDVEWFSGLLPAVRSALAGVEGFAQRLMVQADQQTRASAEGPVGIHAQRSESAARSGTGPVGYSAVALADIGSRATASAYLRSLSTFPNPGEEERGRLRLLNRLLTSGAESAGGRALLLRFDPAGDGRIVLSLGDPATSQNVALLVPGVGTQMGNFAGLLERAAALRRNDPNTAVIAWLGYDAPAGLGDIGRLGELMAGAGEDRAELGARRLQAFVSDLNLAPSQRVTVVGHSYGSVVAMRAVAGGGLPSVDNVVVLGSPGMESVNSVADLGLSPGQSFFSAAADRDLIAGTFGDLVPGHGRGMDQFVPVAGPVGMLAGSLATVRMPSDAGFGGRRLETDSWGRATAGSVGHSQYLVPGTGSLENVRGVVTGGEIRERSLQLDDFAGWRRGVRGELAEMAKGLFGPLWQRPSPR